MNRNKEILEKLDKVVSKQPSKWHEEAKFRSENRDWLRNSQAISLKILRRLRELELSQKELAKIMSVSPQQINKWVKGKENFTIETITKIENALRFSILNLVDIHESKSTIRFSATVDHIESTEKTTGVEKVTEPEYKTIPLNAPTIYPPATNYNKTGS